MKKIIIILFSFLILAWCWKLSSTTTNYVNKVNTVQKPKIQSVKLEDNNPSYSFIINYKNTFEYLNSLYNPTDLSNNEIDTIKSQITQLKNSQQSTTTISMIANNYIKIWYSWKALLQYLDYMNSKWLIDFDHMNNLSTLYTNICMEDNKFNYAYCKNAIQSYYILIEKFKYNDAYLQLIELLVSMWEKSKAQKVYNLYIQDWWSADLQIEKKLN